MTDTPASPDPNASAQTAALRQFVATVTQAVERSADEAVLLPQVRAALATLIARDDWLPAALAQPHPQYYQQYLLHCDPLERFSRSEEHTSELQSH